MSGDVLSWAIFVVSVGGFFTLLNFFRDATNKNILSELKEIKEALMGTMDRKGLITKVHEQEIEIDSIKKICNERHYKKESYAKA